MALDPQAELGRLRHLRGKLAAVVEQPLFRVHPRRQQILAAVLELDRKIGRLLQQEEVAA